MEKTCKYIENNISKILCCIILLSLPMGVFSQKPDGNALAFPFEIVKTDSVGTKEYGSNKIYAFLEEKHFNRKNLLELFAYLSKEYPERSLSVNVFTDREMLLQYIKAESITVPDFIKAPQGEKARQEFFDKNYPPETGYFSASYSRNARTEFFQYSLLKYRGGAATVTLRDSNKFVNSEKFLFDSVKAGYLDAVKWILAQKPQLNIKDETGATPLIYALSFHHNEIAKSLISAGANVNAADTAGLSPLIHATESENYEGVKLLIENKADINVATSDGITALMVSAVNCNSEITKLLLESGANKTRKDNKGKTALAYACDNKEITKLLSFSEADNK